MIEPRGRRLGRVSLAPVLACESPRDFDVVGVRRLMVKTAHPEEHAVVGPLDGEQPDPFPLVKILRPLGDRIGVRAGDRPSQPPSHLRIGVQGGVVSEVVATERAQRQPWCREDLFATPGHHRHAAYRLTSVRRR
jgi:hypothetical protein